MHISVINNKINSYRLLNNDQDAGITPSFFLGGACGYDEENDR